MKTYIFSLIIGLIVGIFYALIHVKSPAPPIVALVGLLGMVVGESCFPMLLKLFSHHS